MADNDQGNEQLQAEQHAERREAERQQRLWSGKPAAKVSPWTSGK